jgi:hypothetical protein
MAKQKDNSLNEVDTKAKSMGAVHAIRVMDEDKTYSLYLKAPHRDIVGLYYARVKDNPIKAAENLFKASQIVEFSDKAIFEIDSLFYSAYLEVDNYLDSIKLKKSLSVTL